MTDTADNSVSVLEHRPGLRESLSLMPGEISREGALGAPRSLPEMAAGCEARLTANEVTGLLRQRLVDLGFTPGASLRLVRRGPNENLIAVSVRDTMIALRTGEVRALFVTQSTSAGEGGND